MLILVLPRLWEDCGKSRHELVIFGFCEALSNNLDDIRFQGSYNNLVRGLCAAIACRQGTAIVQMAMAQADTSRSKSETSRS